MFSSATQPRHTFVVSAITFEGFKLRSSNLTHALLIQILISHSGGHFVKNLKKKFPYGSEMARNAIESEFRTSKMADPSEMVRNAIQIDFRTSKMATEFKTKFCIDLKWPELRSKVNFGNTK